MGLLLSIPPSHRELFSRLVDSKNMLSVLQQALPALADVPVELSDCRVRVGRSRSVLRQNVMRLTYRVKARVGGAPEREYVLLGTAPVGPDDLDQQLIERCKSLVGHEAVEPFQRLSTYLPDLKLALHFFPADPAMPALAEITGPGGRELMRGYLGLGEGVSVDKVSSELKHYKAFNRAVLRVTTNLTGGETDEHSVYVKLFGDDRGAKSYRAFRALWEASREARCLRVPEPMAYDAERRVLVMSEAEGRPELTEWIRCLEHHESLPEGVDLARAKAAMAATAEALAELQACTIAVDQTRDFANELRQMGKDKLLLKDEVREREPELVGRALALYERLRALAPDEGTERFALAHGGFRHKQMVGNENCLTIIDWDGLCLASPCFDGAKFLARLHQEGVIEPGQHPQMEELADTFRAEFLARVPLATERELDLYEGLVFTERTLRAFRRTGTKHGAARIQRLAGAAETLLDRVESAG